MDCISVEMAIDIIHNLSIVAALVTTYYLGKIRNSHVKGKERSVPLHEE